jgi:hypothetical protein
MATEKRRYRKLDRSGPAWVGNLPLVLLCAAKDLGDNQPILRCLLQQLCWSAGICEVALLSVWPPLNAPSVDQECVPRFEKTFVETEARAGLLDCWHFETIRHLALPDTRNAELHAPGWPRAIAYPTMDGGYRCLENDFSFGVCTRNGLAITATRGCRPVSALN